MKNLLTLSAMLAAFMLATSPAWAQQNCNETDEDNDGFDACVDCNDRDPTMNPGRTEVCDNKDNDCDGNTDNRTPGSASPKIQQSCYTGPAGTNGVGECRGGTQTCQAGAFGSCQGQVTPRTETCNDNRDLDCDGQNDRQLDADGDNSLVCDDCNDRDAARFPGNTEICDRKDNNCNGQVDEGLDPDQDGFTACTNPPDCKENDPTVYPGAPEDCDGVDKDCGVTDDDELTRSCWNVPVAQRGVGQCTAGVQTCNGSSWRNDCNGGTPSPEVCDGEDNDCDPSTQDADLFTEYCYTGPAGTDGVGLCHGVTRSCNGPNGWPSNCPGEVRPRSENCNNTQDRNCDGNPLPTTDRDNDGYISCDDCNDRNADINPGVNEICNGIDDNCDGNRDEGFADADNDGATTCTDCDDNDPDRYPGNNEACDGVDNDCDASTLDTALRRQCNGPGNRGPCNNGNESCVFNASANRHEWNGVCVGQVGPEPEACDSIDNDCDGTVDEGFDNDGDGVTPCTGQANPDCDDNDEDRYPGNREVCDGVDNDCDSSTQDAQLHQRACYTGPAGTAGVGLCKRGTQNCDGPSGWPGPIDTVCTNEVTPAQEVCDGEDNDCNNSTDEGFPDEDGDGFDTCTDCNDQDAAINFDAEELCNDRDDNCDGVVDMIPVPCYEGPAGTAGVGVCKEGSSLCVNGAPSGVCENQVLPSAEACNGMDDNCNQLTDESFDKDKDGVLGMYPECTMPGPRDCDDENPFVAPGLRERCDCIDNDCNNLIDERTDAQGMTLFHTDGSVQSLCELGACHDFDGDFLTNCDGDCNDTDNTIFPGAPEVCDAGEKVDDDCDGSTLDEDSDEDADGFTPCQGDCDDRFANINPNATEVCDGFDNNCDGRIDEGFDNDRDGVPTCANDCDDNNPLIRPNAQEICGNSIDDDCDLEIDPTTDRDGDGVPYCRPGQGRNSPEPPLDCNDFNPAVHGIYVAGGVSSAAEEICDQLDNDCNNIIDDGADADGDTFEACADPRDCDDTRADVHPFAPELMDGIDNNCNGLIDESSNSDGDMFSVLCGDCNDTNPDVHPHAQDVCDGFDNDCDGRIDQDPRGVSTCLSCNDVDLDGVTDCDGDCDDTNPAIHPNAIEICDGDDNNCDSFTDINPTTNENLCLTGSDGGTSQDGSTTSTTSTTGGSLDGGVTTNSGVTGQEGRSGPTPIDVQCGCSAVGAGPPDSEPHGAWAALLLFLFVAARPGRRLGRTEQAKETRSAGGVFIGVLFASSLLNHCTRFDVGGNAVDPSTVADTGPATDGGSTDGATQNDGSQNMNPDAKPQDGGTGDGATGDGGTQTTDGGNQDGGSDGGASDAGGGTSLIEGACRLAEADRVAFAILPGGQFQLAHHKDIEAEALSGPNGLVLDDHPRGLRGFAIRLPLPTFLDARDPSAASDYLDQIIDPLFERSIPGVVGIAERVDETLKQSFRHSERPAARTLRRITMVNDVLPSKVRDGMLASLSQRALSDIGGLPSIAGESPSRSLRMAAFVETDFVDDQVNIVMVMADEQDAEDLSLTMADLTNGSHIGPGGAAIATECENDTAENLAVDFLWVVDNSGTMLHEQQALSSAAAQFFESLGRTRIDFRLGVITTDGPVLRGGSFTRDLDEFEDRVLVGINGSINEQGLLNALKAVETATAAADPKMRLRPNVVTVAIFYSDEDSVNIEPVETFIDGLSQFHVIAFAIVGPRPKGCVAVGQGIASSGDSYIQAAEALGGTSASICSEDLTGPIEEILIAAAGAASQTQLEGSPISGSIELTTSSTVTPRSRQDGFDYEPSGNSILFFGPAALPQGNEFRVTYQRFLPFAP